MRRMPEAEHRADVLFALPQVPRRIRLLGEPRGWEVDLRQRGFEIGDEGPDTIVSGDEPVSDAVAAAGDATVLVDGSRSGLERLRAARAHAEHVVSLPLEGSPALFVDLAQRRATRFAFARALGHTELWRTARNLGVAVAAGAGVPLPLGRAVGIAAVGEPALVAAARALADLGTRCEWLMLVSPGSVVRRNAFLLFPDGAGSPVHALKFGRVRGMTEPFDRDDAGYAEVARAPLLLRARCPEYLGRFSVDGFHASLETAAVGTRLSTTLRRPLPRRTKIAAVERVASWLREVARATAGATPLPHDRERLLREVLPRRLDAAQIEKVTAALDRSPGSFQHNDLAEENVVVSRGDFRIVDWEWAQPDGIPIGDLLYFGVHVLRLVDGVGEDGKEAHFRKVITGPTSSSARLFSWLRDLARDLGLERDAVAALATASWLRREDLSVRERLRAERVGGARLEPAFAERIAEIWMTDPDVGPDWRAFR